MSDDDLSRFGSDLPPRKEDILFRRRSIEKQRRDAFQGMEDWVYSTGFRLAAHHLAEQVGDTGTEQGFLIYPIIYLYRHYVELVLKAIIKSASGICGREITKDEKKTLGRHDLGNLWQTARQLLTLVCDCAQVPLPFPVADLEGLGSYIRQIHDNDPRGESFRYATTKTDEKSLSPDLDLVKEITALITAMEKLADYLEDVEWWLVEVGDAKAEFRRIYGR